MDFLKDITGSSPVPAGGAAVAFTASLAIGLIYKVVVFEIERGKGAGMETNLLTLKRELEKLYKDTEKLIKEDPEIYTGFAQSLRTRDKMEMKQHFSKILDVSLKVMEKSDSGLFWINQLRGMVPKRMMTHLLVAGELLMGAINGTVHVAGDNIQNIKAPEKRETYLKRIGDQHAVCIKKYEDLMKELTVNSEA